MKYMLKVTKAYETTKSYQPVHNKSQQLMSLCCELLKVMHSRDKVQLTGMHDRQELDGS